ncbi:MAG: group III truncated hemoglobin [Bacteroidetes bacterium]|nr:group III truncated hemoglobin [Bacteroidota bacterium]MBS1740219.1 group III truncated hemoglobin [Bacteroidota bacterium]MBS1775921.1 group III truncated hemoglobin [Bacteroidota bacterium]
MTQKHDIKSIADIELLVNSFYDSVRTDSLLGPIFNGVIQDRWPEHLAKMYRFWQTVLLDEQTYFGAPFPPHAKLPVSQQHFDQWLKLWYATLDTHFEGEIAKEAKWRGDKMAAMFLAKIEYFRDNERTALV